MKFWSGAALPIAALVCGCTFDPTLRDDISVTCQSDRECPDPATFCAKVDPASPGSSCVRRDRVSEVTITGVTVSRDDGSPATRFSRVSGFDRGRVNVELAGSVQAVSAVIAGALVSCDPPSGTSTWSCPFAATADTVEGAELARLTASDLLGRTTGERAPVTFDFTAPAVVAATVTTRVGAPSASPLAQLGPSWAPAALATGSSLQLTFGLDEATARPVRTWLDPGADLVPPQKAGTIWVASAVVPAGIPDGPVRVKVITIDDVGNSSAEQTLTTLVKDDAPPAAPRVDGGATRVERRPFAPQRQGTFLALDRAVEPDSVVLALLPTASFAVGIVRADATGSVPSTQLAVADTGALRLVAVDAAGNASPPADIRRFTLHATPGDGLIPNPSNLERRPQFVLPLLLTRTLSASGPAMQADDGLVYSASALPTWRREAFDRLDFTCGAAITDTARGAMVIAGAWPSPCPDANASLVFFNGAGARRANPPFASTARGVPVYDSLRSRTVILPLVGGGAPPIIDTNFIARTNTPPSGVTFVSGAYDPRADRVFGLTAQGAVLMLLLPSAGWVDGGVVPRLGASIAWSHHRDAVVLAGGTQLDGGVSTDLLAWDGAAFTRVSSAPPVATAQLLWDLNVHALRLVEQGTPNSWLELDGGFVAQPGAPVNIDWWASWPGRQHDTWLNPGKKSDGTWGLIVRDGGVRALELAMPAQPRSGMQAVALLERGTVLVGGGADGLFPFGQYAFYDPGFGWHRAADGPTLGLGALLRLADGGVLVLGGITLDAGSSGSVANSEVFRLDLNLRTFVPLGVVAPRPAAPTAAWVLPDRTIYTHGGTAQLVPQSPSRFTLDTGALVELDAGATPRFRSTCAISLDDGTALTLGGERAAPFTGCATGVCVTSEGLRLSGGSWVADPALRLPVARSGHVCSFDSARGTLVVAAGSAQNGSVLEHALAASGWQQPGEYTPDGIPDVRDRAVMVFDRTTASHVMFGGRDPTTQESFSDVWRLENFTARPGIVWRLPLEDLLVSSTARALRLTVRARAGATGVSAAGAPRDGLELMMWRDGAWEVLGANGSPPGAPTDLSATLRSLDPSWFERNSVNVGVRALGMRGAQDATVSVDSFEWELEYELPP